MANASFLLLGIEEYQGSPSCEVYRTLSAPTKKKAWEKVNRTIGMRHLKNRKLFREVR